MQYVMDSVVPQNSDVKALNPIMAVSGDRVLGST